MAVNIDKISITNREILSRSVAGFGPQRLWLNVTQKKIPVTYESVEGLFRNDESDHVFLPDTCFFTAHEVPQSFWDTLLGKRIAITSSVYDELTPWRKNAFYNARMVEYVEAGITSEGPPVVPAESSHWGSDWNLAHQYYTTLLTDRKDRALELVAKFQSEHKREPTRDELLGLIKELGSDRDVRILLKAVENGRDSNWWTDESLVVRALQIAVISGTPTSILTRDKDVLEQFERLCQLVTIDYQSYLFGNFFKKYSGQLDIRKMEHDRVLDSYFNVNESVLVRKPVVPDDFVNWLLPTKFHPAEVSCVLFGGAAHEMTVEIVAFSAEQEITHLMTTKGKTFGCNCDLPNGKNCYVTGFPETIKNPREYVIIADDRWLPGNGTPMRWSVLDRVHARFNDGVYVLRTG